MDLAPSPPRQFSLLVMVLREVNAVDPQPARHADRRRLRAERQAVAELSMADRVRNREIGFIFPSFNLIVDLTAYENVELPLTYCSLLPAERKDNA